jgi:hypothetical protein
MPLGQSFAPLGNDDPLRESQAPGGAISPVQEAIKLLSLRLPRYVGQGSPIPQGLLSSPGMAGLQGGMPGMAGQQGNPIAEMLMRMISGGFGGSGSQMTQPFGAPPPKVVPGVNEGEPAPGSFSPGSAPLPPAPAPAPPPMPNREMTRETRREGSYYPSRPSTL